MIIKERPRKSCHHRPTLARRCLPVQLCKEMLLRKTILTQAAWLLLMDLSSVSSPANFLNSVCLAKYVVQNIYLSTYLSRYWVEIHMNELNLFRFYFISISLKSVLTWPFVWANCDLCRKAKRHQIRLYIIVQGEDTTRAVSRVTCHRVECNVCVTECQNCTIVQSDPNYWPSSHPTDGHSNCIGG